MRRILIAATILAAGCGGKRTIPATPEIKAAATQAQLGANASGANTQASLGLQSLGASIGDAAAAGNVSTVDLTGLPAPVALAARATSPSTVQQGLRSGAAPTQVTTPPSGCIQRNPSTQAPQLIPSGTGSCTASGHLEVHYDNGDQVNITWSGDTTSFDLSIEVVAGPWTGTHLIYHGTGSAAGATVTLTGVMKFTGTRNIDADFALTFVVSVGGSASSPTVTISVNGTVTDHLAQVSAMQGWSSSTTSSVSGQTQHATVDFNGTLQIVTTAHSVAFNLNLHVVTDTTPTTVSSTYSATGDVEWDGAVVGTLSTQGKDIWVHWTDGTDAMLNLSGVVG
jgi:hypothetical protein